MAASRRWVVRLTLATSLALLVIKLVYIGNTETDHRLPISDREKAELYCVLQSYEDQPSESLEVKMTIINKDLLEAAVFVNVTKIPAYELSTATVNLTTFVNLTTSVQAVTGQVTRTLTPPDVAAVTSLMERNKVPTTSYSSLELKKILMWTPYWNGLELWNKIFIRQVSGSCPVSDCELLFNHTQMEVADAVLFHAVDLHPHYNLPTARKPGQVWVFFSIEPPPVLVKDMKVKLRRLAGVFNWTMTYRQDSDVVVPYGSIKSVRQTTQTRPAKILDYWSTKTKSKFGAWMVSNCNTHSGREVFMKDLARYMPVDVFGACGKKKCGQRVSIRTLKDFDPGDCYNEIEKYKFYFALENSICRDYVTEKLFTALQLDIVPVVMGGADYATIAPPNSFINALDFSSASELATFLMKVAENATLYNNYFKWKPYYKVELGHPFKPMICDLCAKLHGRDLMTPSRPLRERVGKPANDTDHPVTKIWVTNGNYNDLHGWFLEESLCYRWNATLPGKR